MLAKNRASAFINSLATMIVGLTGYIFCKQSLDGQQLLPSSMPKPWEIGLLLLILLLLTWALSRSWIVMGLDESGFGIQGLVRWAVVGLMVGMFWSLYEWAVLGRMEDDGFWFNILQPAGALSIMAFIYWLIFRRNFFELSIRTENASQGWHFTSWFFLFGGVLIVGACCAAVWVGISRNAARLIDVRGSLLMSGAFLLGLGTILLGALGITSSQVWKPGRYTGLAFGLILTGIALMSVSMLVDRFWPGLPEF